MANREDFLSVRVLFRGVVPTALHKGDERTRELEVWIDNVEWVTRWTSSGTTTGFEDILMPMPGIVGEDITIRATLEDGEWIGITEVRALSEGSASRLAEHTRTRPLFALFVCLYV